MAILCVQFADKDTVIDSRGGVGLSPPPALDVIENKYRYEAFWDIIFQPTDSVKHPESDFPLTYARGNRGFFQYGSLRRYIEDNSYGLHTVVPYRAWSASSGLINTVTPDSSGDPKRAIVNWLTVPKVKMIEGDSGKIKANFESPYTLADSAILAAKEARVIAWDSIDVVIIYYAGLNAFGYSKAGTFRDSEDTIQYAISSERYGVDGDANAFCFIYPRVVFHEFLHAAFGAQDLHYKNIKPYCVGVGHFSIMGDSSPLAAYTPEMLDPWHKLRMGWLRYYVPDALKDTLNLITPIDTTNFYLPVVSEPYNGGPPYVLVIPFRMHPDVDGWNRSARRYLIVENRRAVGWDRVVAVDEMDKNSPTYGQIRGTCGFLIWTSALDRWIEGWVYDADGDFRTWQSTELYGEPEDVYDGSPGRNVFSLWSEPNVFSWPEPNEGVRLKNEDQRNVYIEFPPYVDSSNINPISRLVIDRFVPAAHTYGDFVEEDVSPTKYAAQKKIHLHDTLTLAMFRADGKTYVMSGKDVDDLRDVACLNYAIAASDTLMDNSALTFYPNPALPSKWSMNYVWQQETEGGYFTRVEYADAALSSVKQQYRKTWGPFQQQPRPVIASRGQFGVLAFAGDDGIYSSTSTNAGMTWSEPALVPGSQAGSGIPCILMDSEARGDSAWLLAFVNRLNLKDETWLHRSSTNQTVRLSDNNQSACANPNASRLGDKLSVVYQYHDTKRDRNHIARIEVDLSKTDPPNDRDAFGLLMQKDDDVNRDPALIYTDTSDARKSLLYWVFNKGEKLLSAATYEQNDSLNGWYRGIEGALSSKPTSYPHLLLHEPGNPKLVVSRTGSSYGMQLLADSTPAVVVMTRNEDLDANPALLRLATQLGMMFRDAGGDHLMHARWRTPVVVRVADTIAIVHYDYGATKNFASAVMDSLTRTRVFNMTDEDVAVFALDLSMSQTAPDTIIFESQLVDAVSGQSISGSGEMRIAPRTGDTTVYIGLELPNGDPPTDCFIVTSMARGYYQPGELPRLDLTRYMLYSTETMPKRNSWASRVLPQTGSIQTYPQPTRDELRFVVEGAVPEASRAQLFDLLGRRVAEAPLLYNGRNSHGSMKLEGLVPGMYILTVPAPEGVRTTKVLVAR
ncbi:MAG: T9SS type A sorting domain-containing protein [Bacteroidia bacterium]|nr:T9SS type A sorting domain-containing protein [Bacteroidia bacterium]